MAEAGRFSEAFAEIPEVTETEPDYYDVLVLRGHLGVMMDNLEQADVDLNRAIQASRHPSEAFITRGWLRCKQQRLSEAIEDALRACELSKGRDGRYYKSLVLRAHVRRITGDRDQAEADLNQAIQLWWPPQDALIERAWLRCSQKRFEEGIADVLRACEMCHDNVVLQRDAQEVLDHLRTEEQRVPS